MTYILLASIVLSGCSTLGLEETSYYIESDIPGIVSEASVSHMTRKPHCSTEQQSVTAKTEASVTDLGLVKQKIEIRWHCGTK